MEKLETLKGRLRFLSHEKADKLIEKDPKHLKPVIITALETGGPATGSVDRATRRGARQ